MPAQSAVHDQILDTAVAAVTSREPGSLEALNDLPAPIYVTDAEGRISFFNRACITFAGRTPQVGRDRWCVTWKLYTQEGEFLPHEDCPMAIAIRQKRQIRGQEAVAERPDGSRVLFRPYPTPILDEDGELVGAVNMLVDITDLKQVEHLKEQSSRCRRLARSVDDDRTRDTLNGMATQYAEQARKLERRH